jgi:hypothetical protein
MKASFTKSVLVGGAAILTAGSALALTIPTTPATHEANLTELYIGSPDGRTGDGVPLITLNPGNDFAGVLIDAGGLTVGENTNINNGNNATIAGGGYNTIEDTAENAVIGGGRENKISAPNSIIA